MEQAERITSLIEDVIDRIPESDRASMRVKAFEMRPLQEDGELAQYCLGYIFLDGEKLASFSDEAVRAVIAHEIAHSVSGKTKKIKAQGVDVLLITDADDYSIGERERAVDKRIQEWGFGAELEALNRESKEKVRQETG